ncbi:hypothetical protein [Nocardia africana]|uniref:D-alanyl-D-alanine carboxypeptidase n=1 Tax=Nocardia africana TaxID=134964 RepID=A0ABW6NDM3_9NOCA
MEAADDPAGPADEALADPADPAASQAPADGSDGHAGVAGTVEADADAEPSARTTPPGTDDASESPESPDVEPAAERTPPKPAGKSADGSDDTALADKEDINP